MKKINLFSENNLLPAIIQEDKTGEVLMLGYINKEAFEKTKQTGLVYFWSRSRNKLWLKGEQSGNKLKVKKILTDCDKDALLIQVELIGKYACHKNRKSCFINL